MATSTGPVTGLSRSQVTVKTVLIVCLTALGVATAIYFLVTTIAALKITLFAALIAIALDHAVGMLERRGARRSHAITAVLVMVVVMLGSVGLMLVPPAVQQAKSLAAQAPELLDRARTSRVYRTVNAHFHVEEQAKQAERTPPPAQQDSISSVAPFAGVAPSLLRAVGGVLAVVASVLATAFLVVFMLVFGGGLVRRLLAEATQDRRETYERVVQKIYKSIGGYLAGLTFICGINATLTTIVLALMRVPFFLPLGFLSGFSSMVPYAGPISVGMLITLIVFVTKGPALALVCGGYFVAYGQLEGHVLGPLIYRRTVNVSPLFTLLSVLFFVELDGVVGAVLAVPVVAAVQIILRELLEVRRARLERAGEPAVSPAETHPRPQPT